MLWVEPAETLAEPTGLEPATSGLTGRCANQLHYGSACTPRQTRRLPHGMSNSPTSGLRSRVPAGFAAQSHVMPNGGRNRARTCDHLRVKQALYQLSYSPEPIPSPNSGLRSRVLADFAAQSHVMSYPPRY